MVGLSAVLVHLRCANAPFVVSRALNDVKTPFWDVNDLQSKVPDIYGLLTGNSN